MEITNKNSYRDQRSDLASKQNTKKKWKWRDGLQLLPSSKNGPICISLVVDFCNISVHITMVSRIFFLAFCYHWCPVLDTALFTFVSCRNIKFPIYYSTIFVRLIISAKNMVTASFGVNYRYATWALIQTNANRTNSPPPPPAIITPFKANKKSFKLNVRC